YASVGTYLLAQEAEKALLTKPNERGTYEKDVIKTDEKLNIIYSVFNGTLFNIYPKVKDSINLNDDNYKWYSPLEAKETFLDVNQLVIDYITRG
ncbi:cytochrome C biogenesis protein, partial [Aliarcobacter butzleri]